MGSIRLSFQSDSSTKGILLSQTDKILTMKITNFLFLFSMFLFLTTAASVEERMTREKRQAEDGGDILNGCDPTTNIGGFLIFASLRAYCEEKGFTDFGPYGRR